MRKFVLLSLTTIAFLAGCTKEDSNNSSGIVPISTGNTSSNNSATSNNTVDNSEEANNHGIDANNEPNPDGGSKGKVYGVKNPDRIFQLDSLATTTIQTPGGPLKLWIMDDESKRQEGMMFLHDNEVKDNEGMLFLFPNVQKLTGNYSFWMSHTVLPLDIDYISKDKKVLNVGKGKPFSEDPVKPAGDYFYVLEVKQGLSAKFGLTPNAKIQISDDLKGKP
jgi:hypothetical protein